MSQVPPGFTPYPRPRVDPPHLNLGLDVLSEAWRLFWAKPGLWLLNGLIGTMLIVPFMYDIVLIEWQVVQDPLKAPETLLPVLLLSAGAMILCYVHMAGSHGLASKQIAGELVCWRDVLTFKGRLLPTLVMATLLCVAELVGYCMCYVPGPLVEGITLEAPFRVVDLGESPWQAVRGSYQAVRSRLLLAVVTVHVLTIIVSLAMTCGIGLIVGLPLYNICRVLLYHRSREGEKLRSASQPPPVTYPIELR